jgi:hypothetical protein
MPTISVASDAAFYTVVHEAIESERNYAGRNQPVAEQRAADRRPFDCQQLLAPFDGVHLPGQSEFCRVACQDLSPGGFSFVWLKRVDFEDLVVALGQVPFKFFTARVQNQTRVRLKGKWGYRIGCRFTGRIVAE